MLQASAHSGADRMTVQNMAGEDRHGGGWLVELSLVLLCNIDSKRRSKVYRKDLEDLEDEYVLSMLLRYSPTL